MADYAVIIPTLNEKENILPTIERMEQALTGLDWEAIFVDDDSSDGTWESLLEIARQKPHVRFIRRVNRRGLASACVEGMLSTSATYLAVMDADLQHDAQKLPDLFRCLSSGEATVAVGSRYTGSGGLGDWDQTRVKISRFATFLASKSLLAPCTDPMSGFFAIHRSLIDKIAEKVSSSGFKILFDILTTPDIPLKVMEVPYTFNVRVHGSTKLNTSIIIDFAWLLIKKCSHRLPIASFLMFCLVGLIGVGVHFSVLYAFYKVIAYNFILSNCIATLVAMTTNYILNNTVTFSTQKLLGKAFLKGYFRFCLVCTFGALVNIAVAQTCFSISFPWFLSAGIGIIAGSIINYVSSKIFIWKSL